MLCFLGIDLLIVNDRGPFIKLGELGWWITNWVEIPWSFE